MNAISTAIMDDKSINVEETKRKLHFLPASTALVKKEKLKLTVSVDAKRGRMTIGKDAVRELGLSAAFYKLYYAQGSRIIGMKIKANLTGNEFQSKEWRQPAINKELGFTIIGVKSLLSQMVGVEQRTYKGLEIKKYLDETPGMLGDREYIYYVELK